MWAHHWSESGARLIWNCWNCEPTTSDPTTFSVDWLVAKSDILKHRGYQPLPRGSDRMMAAARKFIADLEMERSAGDASAETEQRLRHEFRRHGWRGTGPTLAAAVNAEIERLERQTATLRRLREGILNVE